VAAPPDQRRRTDSSAQRLDRLRRQIARQIDMGLATRESRRIERLLEMCRQCDQFCGDRCRRFGGCGARQRFLTRLVDRTRRCERWDEDHGGTIHVFVIGYPGDVGGANTECWHTVKLWRRFGLDVTLIPTWQADPSWRTRLDAIGCRTHQSSADSLEAIPGLPGATIVSFCNSLFLAAAARFRRLGCRIVWVNCMTWLFPTETAFYREHGTFDRYVFQSRHQRETLTPQLRKVGYRDEQGEMIRGALDLDDFPFCPKPHVAGEPFVVGRISRAARDKYSSNTWPIYGRIPHPIRARLMAWDKRVERKVGRPPQWAECLAAGAETPQAFLGSLHCMLQVNGGAGENWPRSGLEAMAAGVPVVVQDRWGWREMIRHGETGYLAGSDDELAFHAARLAYDEDHRLEIVHRARKVLETELADPKAIFQRWKTLFDSLAGSSQTPVAPTVEALR